MAQHGSKTHGLSYHSSRQLQGVVGAPHHGLGQVLELAGIHLAGTMLRGRGDVVPEPGHELRHEAVVEGTGSPGAARRVLAEQGADAGAVGPLVARRRVRGALDAARELRLGLHQLRLQDGDLEGEAPNKFDVSSN